MNPTLKGALLACAVLFQVPTLGAQLVDSTDVLQRQIDLSGSLVLQSGKHRITRSLEFDLAKLGAITIRASSGAATLIMDGPGAAIRIRGTHQGTAAPKTFKPETWNERMPIVEGIEILGNHPKANGIELIQTVQPIISKVAIRNCQHGILLSTRNRNVAISDCQIYGNSGVGIYLDNVNLHQINISNSHISYNRQGGVVVRGGNVRNIQITGCDLEANMPGDLTPTSTANVLLDASDSSLGKSMSIAEVSITGCTIQHSANYSGDESQTIANGGANIRMKGRADQPINMVSVTGNILSDTTVNVEMSYTQDATITGNTFFAPKSTNATFTNCQRILLTANIFNPRQFKRDGTILFVQCSDCQVTNSSIHDFQTKLGAIQIIACENFILNALSFSDCYSGLTIANSKSIAISNCLISRKKTKSSHLQIGLNCEAITQIGVIEN
jgi:hypothetical protein